jgi:VanZ family protein
MPETQPPSAPTPAGNPWPHRHAPWAAPLLRGLWALLLIAAAFIALTPVEQMPQAFQFWDKAQHALAYAGLGLLGLWAWPQHQARVLAALGAHGGLVEVMQATLTTTRQGEWGDWIADALGLLLAWAMAYAFTRFARPTRTSTGVGASGEGRPH